MRRRNAQWQDLRSTLNFFVLVSFVFSLKFSLNFVFQMHKAHLKSFVFEILFIGDYSFFLASKLELFENDLHFSQDIWYTVTLTKAFWRSFSRGCFSLISTSCAILITGQLTVFKKLSILSNRQSLWIHFQEILLKNITCFNTAFLS